MGETPQSPQTPVATIEKRNRAVIARPMRKMAEESDLKAMIRLIDEACTAGSDISLVVVDLSHVTILPSLGLGLLVQISNKCKSRQQQLKLAGVLPQIRQIMSITRLDRMFDFVPNAEAAVE
jgi:anti-sigma B factor antagonist